MTTSINGPNDYTEGAEEEVQDSIPDTANWEMNFSKSVLVWVLCLVPQIPLL